MLMVPYCTCRKKSTSKWTHVLFNDQLYNPGTLCSFCSFLTDQCFLSSWLGAGVRPHPKPVKSWNEPGWYRGSGRLPQVQICLCIRGAVDSCLGCSLHKVLCLRGCCWHCGHLYSLKKIFLCFCYSLIDVTFRLTAHQACQFSVIWQQRDMT